MPLRERRTMSQVAVNKAAIDVDIVWMVLGFFVLTLVLLLGGAYCRIERLHVVTV